MSKKKYNYLSADARQTLRAMYEGSSKTIAELAKEIGLPWSSTRYHLKKGGTTFRRGGKRQGK